MGTHTPGNPQELQEQLTSTRSELADDKQTIVALKEQLAALTSTPSESVAVPQNLLRFARHALRERESEREDDRCWTSVASAGHGLITRVRS